MRVIDVARKLGCSTTHLRRLEKAGLIPSARRDYNGHRRYRPEDLERLRVVLFPNERDEQNRLRLSDGSLICDEAFAYSVFLNHLARLAGEQPPQEDSSAAQGHDHVSDESQIPPRS